MVRLTSFCRIEHAQKAKETWYLLRIARRKKIGGLIISRFEFFFAGIEFAEWSRTFKTNQMNGIIMNQYKNPTWWTNEDDSAWERTKAAFKRDWDQTKHDVGGNEPNTNQNVKDTVKQAAGKEAIPPRGEPNYDRAEPAYRFGYGARQHFGTKHPQWNPDLEKQLRNDWRSTYPDRADSWDTDAEYIRSGWNHKSN
jgi:hypothetical protein